MRVIDNYLDSKTGYLAKVLDYDNIELALSVEGELISRYFVNIDKLESMLEQSKKLEFNEQGLMLIDPSADLPYYFYKLEDDSGVKYFSIEHLGDKWSDLNEITLESINAFPSFLEGIISSVKSMKPCVVKTSSFLNPELESMKKELQETCSRNYQPVVTACQEEPNDSNDINTELKDFRDKMLGELDILKKKMRGD